LKTWRADIDQEEQPAAMSYLAVARSDGNALAFHPPPSALTSNTLAANLLLRKSTAVLSFVSAVVCAVSTLR
jgi:hypothetical protein